MLVQNFVEISETVASGNVSTGSSSLLYCIVSWRRDEAAGPEGSLQALDSDGERRMRVQFTSGI